jgi:molybdate transport system ATP-binding protein
LKDKPATGDAAKRLLTFKDVTLRIRDRHVLKSTQWQIDKGQQWVVLGPNGSGKSTLVRAVAGLTPVVGGSIQRHDPAAHTEAIGYLSFELLQSIVAKEQARDEARYFSGQLDHHMTVAQFMATANRSTKVYAPSIRRAVSQLGLKPLLTRPLQSLSNGEMRKIMISRAALRTRGLLILDEPFDGLDSATSKVLGNAIQSWMQAGIQILLVTHRMEEVLPDFTHVIGLKDCQMTIAGTRESVLTQDNLKKVYGVIPKEIRAQKKISTSLTTQFSNDANTMIDVRNACVRYGPKIVFDRLNWRVCKGEHWVIKGPNGSGKTTLLQMVTGDHPQAYANEIYLFGRRRGSGESVQEIKQRVGLCSAEFQINYRKPIRGLDVVLSGFFDSIGLYRRADQEQLKSAEDWLQRLNLSHLREQRFDYLSYGERRALLLVRAVVKSPDILALDEPCQGLDPANRHKIIALLDDICHNSHTQLLMVTHHAGDLPRCITHQLDMETGRVSVNPRIV